MADNNLWGEIPVFEDIETPMKILREQAAYLEKFTTGVLTARVETAWKGSSQDGVGEDKHNDDLKELHTDLTIVSPGLDGHFVKVVRVAQQLMIYPATIINFLIFPFEYLTANNPSEFKEHLAHVLRSDELQQELVHMLIKAKMVE